MRRLGSAAEGRDSWRKFHNIYQHVKADFCRPSRNRRARREERDVHAMCVRASD